MTLSSIGLVSASNGPHPASYSYLGIHLHNDPGRVLDYWSVIDNFVVKNRDLRAFELSNDDWASISLVTQWLKSFQSATTQMSSTKTSMLLTMHAIFCELLEDIWLSIISLPANMPAQLKNSLVSAHHKLSDYYTQLDESPLYIWLSCEYIIHFTHFYSLIGIDLPIPI